MDHCVDIRITHSDEEILGTAQHSLVLTGHRSLLTGYRILEKLSSSKVLYVDDLVTHESGRSAG